MNDILGSISIIVTVVYAWLTFRILKANQRNVALQEHQVAQERSLRVRDQFLTGITTVMQCDLASPGCIQSLRLSELLCGYAGRAESAIRRELSDLLRCALSDTMRTTVKQTPNAYPNLKLLLSIEGEAPLAHHWLSEQTPDGR
jgi:hypothetical protein